MSVFSFPTPTSAEQVIAKLDNKTYLPTGRSFDPITNREISTVCWNGSHQEIGRAQSDLCEASSCGCLCHERVLVVEN